MFNIMLYFCEVNVVDNFYLNFQENIFEYVDIMARLRFNELIVPIPILHVAEMELSFTPR